MYIPISIEAENLFSFQSLNYDFNNGVTTLVNGENRDNDSQKSNGSGKSSLLEIFSIALTGTPLRKIKNEEIINDSADEGRLSARLSNPTLNEDIIIHRQFFRKSSSIVSIQLFKDGKEIEDKLLTNLSSVDEYNKAILERIGLSKDEIFNSFILSKSRFENFLLSSDTKKKETINQFSRGNAVDQAIEKLRADMKPIADDLSKAKNDLNVASGKLSLLQEQKEECIETAAQKVKSKEEDITFKKSGIQELNAMIRENNESIRAIGKKADRMDEIAVKLEALADSIPDHSPEENIDRLESFLQTDEFVFEKRFKAGMENIDSDGKETDAAITEYLHQLKEIEESQKIDDARLIEMKSKVENGNESKAKLDAFKEKLEQLRKERIEEQEALKQIKQSIENLSSERSLIVAKLAGKVTCPKCSHEFLVADSSFDVNGGRERVSKLEEAITVCEQSSSAKTKHLVEIDAVGVAQKKNVEDIEAQIRKDAMDLESIKQAMENRAGKIDSIRHRVETETKKLQQISERIDAYVEASFNEVISYLDSLTATYDRQIESIETKNQRNKAQIEMLQEQISYINESKEDFGLKQIEEKIAIVKKEKRAFESEVADIEAEYEKYTVQEQDFIDFKTHLANSKIKDLENITNDFLEEIGSDLRIGLSGYTKLKNGTIRDKISVSMMRNGMDAGSFGKLSGGEQARIMLANILALSKLTNINCDDGKGIDLLVLDEILEAVDESGLSAMLDALNETKITCLVVSHGLIRENYENVDLVIKEHGFSRIERL